MGNGSGSVYPRRNKDGKITSYLGAYYGPDGKRRTVSAKTKSDTKVKLREAQATADKGMVFDAGSLTVAAYLQKWLEGIKGTVAENTYIHVTLHKALKDAVLDGLIPRNVTDGVKAPKLEQKEAQYLTQDQARKLLDTAHGDRLEALYVVALHTGLREGELLRLEWSDWRGDYLHVRGTKNKTSERAVKLSKTAQDALIGHRSRQNEERLAAATWEDTGLILTTQAGKQIDRHNLWRQFKRLLKRAELPDVPFHSLRHTCATLLFHAGKDLMYVQNQFGHASSKITRDTYTHHIQGNGGGLADAMDDLLG